MGMFSEIHASINAKNLKKVLLVAMNENDNVKEFVKKNIYNLYLNECGEAWESPDEDIVKFYKDIK